MKLVSIIIPLHNKEKYIYETLQSVQKQTYEYWEAIVWDDGSIDGSREVLNQFKQDKRFVFCYEEECKGANYCRNKGIEISKGEFIVFMDADDILHERCLENRINVVSKNKDYDLWVFPMYVFKHNPNHIKYVWRSPQKNLLEKFISHHLPWQTMQPVWSRSFIEKYQLRFDEKLHKLQDVDFHIQALILRPSVFIVGSEYIPDCYFRSDPDRIQSPDGYIIRYAENYIIFYSKYAEIFSKKPGLLKKLNLSLLNVYIYLEWYSVKEKIHQIFINQVKDKFFKKMNNHLLRFFLNLHTNFYSLFRIYIPGTKKFYYFIGKTTSFCK